MNAFVALIKTMNGKEIDLANTESIIKELSRKGLTIGKLSGFMNEVKKKLTKKLKSFFRITPTMSKQRRVLFY